MKGTHRTHAFDLISLIMIALLFLTFWQSGQNAGIVVVGAAEGRVAKARAAGKYKGRKPLAADLRQEVVRLAAEGMAKTNIARQLDIGEATVYRILAAAKKREA